MFASLNSCRGYNKSRRDDVESILYIVIYMLNKSYLPWSDFEYRDAGGLKSFKELLADRMGYEITKKLISVTPPELNALLKKVLLISFEKKPKYDSYRQILK